MYHSETLIENTLSAEEKKGAFDESTITEAWTKAQNDELDAPEADPNAMPPLSTLINLDDFERAFKKIGSRKAEAYVNGASNDLLTFNANMSYWQRLWFRPRIMRRVKDIDTRMKMLGQEVSMPVFISPMGVAKTAGEEGEKALGAGAAKGGIIHCQSTSASFTIEEILTSVPRTYPYFFQLYVDRNRPKTEELLHKLSSMHNIKALFVTVDLPVVSKREADERVLEPGRVNSAYAGDNGPTAQAVRGGGGVARSAGGFIDPNLCWDDVAWIKKHSSLPIIIKGIQTAADAKIALRMGCAGIVVSNHGGRALDSAPGSLLVLLELRRDCPEIFDQMEVFVDGGVRRGSDVLKAVMLGARGVGVGRPFQCAVAYGTNGVESVCESKSKDHLLQRKRESARSCAC